MYLTNTLMLSKDIPVYLLSSVDATLMTFPLSEFPLLAHSGSSAQPTHSLNANSELR